MIEAKPPGRRAITGFRRKTAMSDWLKVAPYSKIRFYQLLKERFGEQGKNAFFIGFHLYAFRKGICCAQRAVSQGLPLDYNSYQLCRESVFQTPEARQNPGPKSKSAKEIRQGEIVSCNYGHQRLPAGIRRHPRVRGAVLPQCGPDDGLCLQPGDRPGL